MIFFIFDMQISREVRWSTGWGRLVTPQNDTGSNCRSSNLFVILPVYGHSFESGKDKVSNRKNRAMSSNSHYPYVY